VTADVLIRRVELGDVPVARAVRLRALKTDPTSFGSTHEREAAFADEVWEERVTRGARGDDAATFFAFREGMAVGLVSGFRDEHERHVFDVVGMWVAPETRGEGIGRRLLEEVEAWIASCGGTQVRLSVTNASAAARGLYASAGYEPDGRAEHSGHTPGLVEIGMRKLLRE
jgi:ribosomal protein S18 acetylase RimI-like enzyme